MRKSLVFIAVTLISADLLAGGLVTNTNQSASWVRLPSRNASTEIDAVYYNPAGIMKMENGFHFAISNQTIFQTREITSDYSFLNDGSYEGKVKAPLFPSIYAAYKMDKLAFFFGFNPVGGGGGATYEKGLPSFEMSQADLVPALSAAPYSATDYRLDVYFKGSSIFFGYQAGISYKINDLLSVAAGVRYVTAKNTYEGHLKDVQVNIASSNWTDASTIMDGIAATAQGGGDALTPYIATAGGYTADQLVAAGQMTVETRNAIVNGLTSLGVANAASLTLLQSQTAFYGKQTQYNLTSNLLEDQEADVAQTGSGICPIFSVNLSPIENLNIGIKYEMATKLELENETAKDLLIGYTATGTPITMFPDGDKTRNDMPAMLAVGVNYKLANLKLSLGGNYYFDKSADYGHKIDDDLNSATPTVHVNNSEIIESNGMSLQGGLEYNVSENWLVSAGYVYGNKGVNSLYQSDLTFGNATHTFGGGGAFTLNNLRINLGASYTMYLEDEKSVNHFLGATNLLPTETYTKSTMVVGVGVELSF